MKVIHKSGTRKRAVARATLKEGTGKFRFNKKLVQSLDPGLYQSKLLEPFALVGDLGNKIDVSITVNGGGANSQVEAARVALCRALVEHDKKLERVFQNYDRGFLIPDVRTKEAAKPNRHGKARSKRQKSYR